MAPGRLNREDFYSKLDSHDEAALKKILWTLYWRGAQPVRERIEGLIDPQVLGERASEAKQLPTAKTVLSEVRQFVALARNGSYLAGDRRVSPKERSRWRFTFRRLAEESVDALRGDDVVSAGAAVAGMDCRCGRVPRHAREKSPVE